MSAKKFRQSRIALIYDFDSTLTPLAMQEYTVLPHLGIRGDDFWTEVESATRRENSDRMLTWMRLMLEKAEEKKTHLDEKTFRKLASGLKFFPGVESWFGRMNRYVRSRAPSWVKIDHYLISAGLDEILTGSPIIKNFRKVYASRYHYDHHGVATFPAVLINDTMKTQFLFRINKGKEDLAETINEHMPEDEREIPFRNMIYIGDGLSDVPSMTVTRKNGGSAIAVHTPGDRRSLEICHSLLKAGRVDYFARAAYRANRPLEGYVRNLIDLMIADIKNRHAIALGRQTLKGTK